MSKQDKVQSEISIRILPRISIGETHGFAITVRTAASAPIVPTRH